MYNRHILHLIENSFNQFIGLLLHLKPREREEKRVCNQQHTTSCLYYLFIILDYYFPILIDDIFPTHNNHDTTLSSSMLFTPFHPSLFLFCLFIIYLLICFSLANKLGTNWMGCVSFYYYVKNEKQKQQYYDTLVSDLLYQIFHKLISSHCIPVSQKSTTIVLYNKTKFLLTKHLIIVVWF